MEISTDMNLFSLGKKYWYEWNSREFETFNHFLEQRAFRISNVLSKRQFKKKKIIIIEWFKIYFRLVASLLHVSHTSANILRDIVRVPPAVKRFVNKERTAIRNTGWKTLKRVTCNDTPIFKVTTCNYVFSNIVCYLCRFDVSYRQSYHFQRPYCIPLLPHTVSLISGLKTFCSARYQYVHEYLEFRIYFCRDGSKVLKNRGNCTRYQIQDIQSL